MRTGGRLSLVFIKVFSRLQFLTNGKRRKISFFPELIANFCLAYSLPSLELRTPSVLVRRRLKGSIIYGLGIPYCNLAVRIVSYQMFTASSTYQLSNKCISQLQFHTLLRYSSVGICQSRGQISPQSIRHATVCKPLRCLSLPKGFGLA